MKEVINKAWYYVLHENEGEYIISVLCGTIGIFEVTIQLTDTEKSLYFEKGEMYADELAKQIQSSTIQYRDRNISSY